ncbi:MAG TPA: PaaI family thioesterase [Candidatus Dormibacteraeota bacterium]|nr:PaaI family thioesterase [Candidatus Dormibacteraeota bacterium]
MQVKPRTRTITWEDPMAAMSQADGMTGLEFIQAICAGKLPSPPIIATMGFTGGEAEEGKATFHGEAGEYLYNPIGVVHGGFAMTILDSAMGCAVHTTMAAGEMYTTLETKVNFVRPITLDVGPVSCEGVVVHRGGKVVTAEGRLVADESGKLLAHGTTTCLVVKR